MSKMCFNLCFYRHSSTIHTRNPFSIGLITQLCRGTMDVSIVRQMCVIQVVLTDLQISPYYQSKVEFQSQCIGTIYQLNSKHIMSCSYIRYFYKPCFLYYGCISCTTKVCNTGSIDRSTDKPILPIKG